MCPPHLSCLGLQRLVHDLHGSENGPRRLSRHCERIMFVGVDRASKLSFRRYTLCTDKSTIWSTTDRSANTMPPVCTRSLLGPAPVNSVRCRLRPPVPIRPVERIRCRSLPVGCFSCTGQGNSLEQHEEGSCRGVPPRLPGTGTDSVTYHPKVSGSLVRRL